MKRFAGLFSVLAAACCASAPALQIAKVDKYEVAADRAISNEVWILAETIDIRGKAVDDVFALAKRITLSGTFDNDAWAAGDEVVFSGKTADHGRFFGRRVEVNGKIGSSLTAAGSSIQLGKDSVVKGDAVLAGENVVLEGQVQGRVRVLAYSATINGKIGGNLRIIADDIVVMPGSEIRGNLVYTSAKELFLDEKVKLGGRMTRKEAPVSAPWTPPEPTFRQIAGVQVFLYLCALVVAIPFLALFPQFTGRAVRCVRQSPWKSAFAGFAAFCLMPMLSFFALLTIIGIPFGVLLFTTYLMLLYVCKFVPALALGGIILRRRGPQRFSRVLTALFFGLILVYVLAALPVAGGVIWFVITLLGLGGMVLVLFTPAGREVAEPPPFVQPPAQDFRSLDAKSEVDERQP